jgi:hypothetical protein
MPRLRVAHTPASNPQNDRSTSRTVKPILPCSSPLALTGREVARRDGVRDQSEGPAFPREEDQLLARFRLMPAEASGEAITRTPRPALPQCHACGSRVDRLAVSASDRRIVRSEQPDAATYDRRLAAPASPAEEAREPTVSSLRFESRSNMFRERLGPMPRPGLLRGSEGSCSSSTAAVMRVRVLPVASIQRRTSMPVTRPVTRGGRCGGGGHVYADGHGPPLGMGGREREIGLGQAGHL